MTLAEQMASFLTAKTIGGGVTEIVTVV